MWSQKILPGKTHLVLRWPADIQKVEIDEAGSEEGGAGDGNKDELFGWGGDYDSHLVSMGRLLECQEGLWFLSS
ncbi:hypothetical protein O6P43_019496 [Quillaja saponaria]|uniref:Uncharacterized protein n=1 Tax=Quillaja saponaria TaxID=32244 RepID=A0AAD7LIL2_QUISA|nr:hypothetical protein O6P43_019496 [Quillaja saponaria]